MKYYFDTSSLMKIYHREKGTETVLNIYKSQDEIITSELNKIEFISTICRKYREHEISHETLTAVIHKFEDDVKIRYDEMLKFSTLVIDEAWNLICRISEKHSLKTQDSIQFAFFKIYCETDTVFVCSDDKFIKLVENELRINKYRVFYDSSENENVVEIKAVGYKEHNNLFINRKEFEI